MTLQLFYFRLKSHRISDPGAPRRPLLDAPSATGGPKFVLDPVTRTTLVSFAVWEPRPGPGRPIRVRVRCRTDDNKGPDSSRAQKSSKIHYLVWWVLPKLGHRRLSGVGFSRRSGVQYGNPPTPLSLGTGYRPSMYLSFRTGERAKPRRVEVSRDTLVDSGDDSLEVSS